MSKARTRTARAVAIGAALGSATLLIGVAAPAAADHPTVTAVKGSAFGYHAFGISLFGGAQADIGPRPTVTLAADASNSPQSASEATGLVQYGPAYLFTSGQIDVSTSGSLGDNGGVTSSTFINDINTSRVEILGEDNYDCCDSTGAATQTAVPRPLTDISSTCTATSTGVTGSTTISNGWLYLDSGWYDGDAIYPESAADAGGLEEHDPVRIPLPANPAPNTVYEGHIHVAANTTDYFVIVFNEQIVNPDGSLTVNAVHEHFGATYNEATGVIEEAGGVLQGDLIIGQVVCGATTGTSTHVNNPPVATDDAYSTGFDAPLTVPAPGVLTNDNDPNGDALTAGSATDPAGGTVTLNPDGSFTYTPDTGFTGNDTFTYTATDPSGASDTATVTVTVEAAEPPPPVNTLPDAVDDTYETYFGEPLTVEAPGVLGNDTDADGNTLTVTSFTQPTWEDASVTVNPDGSFTVDPGTTYHGTLNFDYTVSDGQGGTDTARVYVNVVPDPTDCNGQDATIVGTEGNDTLVGTAGPDVISGLGGDDTITGLRGDDTICGGPGNDDLDGGAGADFIDGDVGNDSIEGGAGDDSIFDIAGDNNIDGGRGHDFIAVFEGNNTVDAGDGDDFVILGPGDNTVDAGAGNDLIFGDTGNDVLTGGRGNDQIFAGEDWDTGADYDVCDPILRGPPNPNDQYYDCEEIGGVPQT